jgi:integrase
MYWIRSRQLGLRTHKNPSLKSNPSRQSDVDEIVALRLHKDRQAFQRRAATFWEDNDLVFSTGNGRVLNPNNVLRNFAEIGKRPGVPRIRVHDLRHTHATFLLLDGVPLKIV